MFLSVCGRSVCIHFRGVVRLMWLIFRKPAMQELVAIYFRPAIIIEKALSHALQLQP